MESELITMEFDGSEVAWLRDFLANIHLETKLTPSMSMRYDCKSAIAMTKNKSFNDKN